MKTINVHVIPNARKPSIKMENDVLKVKVTAPATDGKANKAIIELLAGHFNVKRSAVIILRGERTREKVIGILL